MSDFNPGITALAGFCFQIKVFIAEMALIQEGQSIHYEIGDDVSSENIADIEEWTGKTKSSDFLTLFQVKRKNVLENSSKKVLYNWLLEDEAQNYKLIVADGYSVNDNFLKNKDTKEIYDELKTQKSPISLEQRVYEKYKKTNLIKEFEDKVNLIRSRYELKKDYNPDTAIHNNYKQSFFLRSDNVDIYEKRIKELCRNINFEIMKAADNKKPYTLSYNQINGIKEQIVENITESSYHINYVDFQKNAGIALDSETRNKREFQQLQFCELTDDRIIDFLTKESYYDDFKNHNLEHHNRNTIDNIESEAFENYKEILDAEKRPTPRKLLSNTIKNKISGTYDKMQSDGTYISLTSDSNKKISWKI